MQWIMRVRCWLNVETEWWVEVVRMKVRIGIVMVWASDYRQCRVVVVAGRVCWTWRLARAGSEVSDATCRSQMSAAAPLT